MKKIIVTMFILFAMSCVIARYLPRPQAVTQAMISGAKARIVFHVRDVEGRPLCDVNVKAQFTLHGRGKASVGLTDENGCVTLAGQCAGEIVYTVSKDGYYDTRGRIWLGGTPKTHGEVQDGQWQPFGKEEKVILKAKKNPIPMYAYQYEKVFEKPQEPMGFDLKVGDFVAPYGRGVVTDFILTFAETKVSFNRLHVKMKLSFPNVADGVYIKTKEPFSELISEYHADPTASYQNELVYEYNTLDSDKEVIHSPKEDRYFVLRTRTKVDEKGNLIEACYSKIYTPFTYVRRLEFTAYMNPTVNDTNLEFLPKSSLRKNPAVPYFENKP